MKHNSLCCNIVVLLLCFGAASATHWHQSFSNTRRICPLVVLTRRRLKVWVEAWTPIGDSTEDSLGLVHPSRGAVYMH